MSSIDPAITVNAPARSGFAEGLRRGEALLARIGDRLNPILVKEARQALKSRQFTVTFTLLLIAGWCWSIFGLAYIGPGVYWSSDGPSMFFGYFLVLAFPLIVVVPYGAFRSLASEREDRTFELLSITTLKARQIVGGKLAGAVLQMVVYLSAISPCLAFTYLLRGLDIVTIVMIVVYLCLGSLGLSLCCLLLATATTEKYQQVVLSVGTIFALGYTFMGTWFLAAEMLAWNVGLDEKDYWVVNAALFTAYASYFLLFYLAAAAQLSFVGSNRSTPLRMAAMLQQVLLVAWMGGIWFEVGSDGGGVLTVTLMLIGIHWYVMGVFMTGEPARLSPRIKRDLPQSFVGRSLHTWFNPGPATGYVFAIANFMAVVVLCSIAFAFRPSALSPFGSGRTENVLLLGGIGTAYLTIFLGVGRLILSWIARVVPTTVAMRLLVHAVLLFIATIVPLTVQMMLFDFRSEGYTMLQTSNPFWTVLSIIDGSPPYDIYAVLGVLSVVAAIVFVLNLPAVADEVRQVRIARPVRVAEEDAELAAAAAPIASTRTNPWN